MKSLLSSSVSVFMLVVPCCVLSQQPTKEHVRLSISGAEVWLGMSQSEALSAMRRAGLTPVALPGSDSFLVQAGTVQFSGARLSYADRTWSGKETTVFEDVIGALATLAPHNAVNCSVQHAPIAQPEGRVDRVFIRCGERTVLVSSGKLNGITANQVIERIGNYR